MTQAEVLLMKDDVILCFDICLVLEFSCKSRRKWSCLHGENPKLVEGNILASFLASVLKKSPLLSQWAS